MSTPPTFGPREISAAISKLAGSIAARHPLETEIVLLGIANGGIELAQRLGKLLRQQQPRRGLHVGTLDISFHRDDFGKNPIPKEFSPTHIPVDVDNATIVLVDDVLFSGRTVKAALDELFDHGRPATVELAVLVDRGGRRLPIAADHVGFKLAAESAGLVQVTLGASATADAVNIQEVATLRT